MSATLKSTAVGGVAVLLASVALACWWVWSQPDRLMQSDFKGASRIIVELQLPEREAFSLEGVEASAVKRFLLNRSSPLHFETHAWAAPAYVCLLDSDENYIACYKLAIREDTARQELVRLARCGNRIEEGDLENLLSKRASYFHQTPRMIQ